MVTAGDRQREEPSPWFQNSSETANGQERGNGHLQRQDRPYLRFANNCALLEHRNSETVPVPSGTAQNRRKALPNQACGQEHLTRLRTDTVPHQSMQLFEGPRRLVWGPYFPFWGLYSILFSGSHKHLSFYFFEASKWENRKAESDEIRILQN